MNIVKIAIIRLHYRNFAHYVFYSSCLPIFQNNFLFLDKFKENANIPVAIKSGCTVFKQPSSLATNVLPMITEENRALGLKLERVLADLEALKLER